MDSRVGDVEVGGFRENTLESLRERRDALLGATGRVTVRAGTPSVRVPSEAFQDALGVKRQATPHIGVTGALGFFTPAYVVISSPATRSRRPSHVEKEVSFSNDQHPEHNPEWLVTTFWDNLPYTLEVLEADEWCLPVRRLTKPTNQGICLDAPVPFDYVQHVPTGRNPDLAKQADTLLAESGYTIWGEVAEKE